MTIFSLALLPSTALYLMARATAAQQPDYREAGSGSSGNDVGSSSDIDPEVQSKLLASEDGSL